MSENEVNITIANRLATAHEKILIAAEKAQRNDSEVNLMAVSKTKPKEDILAAYHAGQRIFGENYAQELAQKKTELSELKDIEWHFIGPIQSNKTQIIAQHANWVDSVDRIKIAKRLNQHCLELNKHLDILVQVNISEVDNKSGIMLVNVESFIKDLQAFQQLRVRGLMAIPEPYDDKKVLISEFNRLNTCFLALKQQYPNVDTLSLGMTDDMESAMLSGSTMIRLGTAIFGPRTNN